jgi:hypothetical protein
MSFVATTLLMGVVGTAIAAGNPSANLDQCANGTLAAPQSCNPNEWVNGNLGSSKAHFNEGDSIPYRMRFDNLALASHTITIEWDTTKSGKHALDYITTFNRTVTLADPCAGVSGCGAPTTFAIPKDPQVDNGSGSPITQVAGNFTLYGGTITAVSVYSYANGTGFAGDKSARITITFSAAQVNPVLAWGGHIATRANWGPTSAAVAIPGSPYHMRLIALDGSGGNQDRSLSADAVTFPGSITIIKNAVPDDAQDFAFSSTGGLTPSTFSLDDDTNATLSNTQAYSGITNFVAYTVTETQISGWTLSFGTPVCSVASPNGGSQSGNATTGVLSISLKEGENVSCTFTNSRQAAHLIIIKQVTNDNGGSALPGAFSGTITGVTASGGNTWTGTASPGVDKTLTTVGSYNVTETAAAGYTPSFSTDCTGTIAFGQTKTCTVTNDDNGPGLHLRKTITNDNGGSAAATDWTLTATGTGATPTNLSGTTPVDSGAGFKADTYTLGESGPAGYTASAWSCVGGTQSGNTIQIGLGGSATCTINNDDNAPALHLRKTITNDNGGSAAITDWTLTATGTGATPTNLSGTTPVDSGTGFKADTYTLAEINGPDGYTAGSWSCVGGSQSGNTIQIGLGGSATCTINNDDTKASPKAATDMSWTLHDSATISDLRADGGSHSVTFKLFNNATCDAGTELFSQTVTDATGNLTSFGPVDYLTSSEDTYYWTASYSGNTNNDGFNSGCGDEVTTIGQTNTSHPANKAS